MHDSRVQALIGAEMMTGLSGGAPEGNGILVPRLPPVGNAMESTLPEISVADVERPPVAYRTKRQPPTKCHPIQFSAKRMKVVDLIEKKL